MTQAMKNQVDDKQIRRLEAMINSMTPHERRFPKVINGSRKKRIAAGSGTQIQDVNRLLKQFLGFVHCALLSMDLAHAVVRLRQAHAVA